MVEGTHRSLLSFTTARKLGFIHVKINNITSTVSTPHSDLIQQYPSVESGGSKTMKWSCIIVYGNTKQVHAWCSTSSCVKKITNFGLTLRPDKCELNKDSLTFFGLCFQLKESPCTENKDWKKELYTFLLNFRTTPHTTTGFPPSELLFNCLIRT